MGTDYLVCRKCGRYFNPNKDGRPIADLVVENKENRSPYLCRQCEEELQNARDN